MKKIKKTMDGNTAAAYISYAFSEIAFIYPITPSSTMAELVDEWAAKDYKNIFNSKVKVVEMQSEAGAAGALHGALQAGALTTTFTASQGLLLMMPNMYKIAGEMLPCVFQVASRTIATHALSIFGDHSDVMAVRQTGFAILSSSSVQEVMDMSVISYLSTFKSRIPFLNFFDGFRTSHEIQKIEIIEYDDLRKMVDKDIIYQIRKRALNPENPTIRGTSQSPDIYFQQAESKNKYYNKLPDIIKYYMQELYKITGRNYKIYDFYGCVDADRIIVAMGSVCETIEEVVDYLNSKNEKVGLVKVRLFRPFVKKDFLDIIPKSVKKIAVLDKTKENGSIGEPLFLDVVSAFYEVDDKPIIVGGRYGLSSKDTTHNQINAVFEMLKENPKNNFTIGIVDDVTFLSLEEKEKITIEDKSMISCKFFGLGSDGTVGANKQAIKIIGDYTEKYAQGYFSYDSKKSGGLTISHLRFGDNKIRSAYLIDAADYIACHAQSYIYRYDVLKGLKKDSVFVLNTVWKNDELKKYLPLSIKKYLFDNNIKFYVIDANKIAQEVGLGRRINMIMQTVFFKLSNIIDINLAVELLKKSISNIYSKKGEDVVNMNYLAIDRALEEILEINIDEDFLVSDIAKSEDLKIPNFVKKFLIPIETQKGNDLKVSDFYGIEDGVIETGTAKYEKRAIAINIPKWKSDNCIQCVQCSLVCPHGAIRPFLVSKIDENDKKPATFETIQAIGRNLENYEFRIQVSPLDCTGCGVCVQVCPGKKNIKALEMESIEKEVGSQVKNWEYAMSLSDKGDLFDKFSMKGSQFQKPLFEFSGACAGCGETAYIKLITQLFGEKMMIANATGCSSIYGASNVSTPYCKNEEGKGPAWANSLFEDNAEFGLGMKIAQDSIRNQIKEFMLELVSLDIEGKEYFQNWIENMNDDVKTKEAIFKIVDLFGKDLKNDRANELLKEIEKLKDYLRVKSQWIIGGDGWAYDIGYGGLDHVVASGENVNILILDTEVYSNTGGQASKSTPLGAIAKFSVDGMKSKKKDLALMLSTYQNAYIAQISLGANMNQTIKAIKEAESYDGPSILIAYSPCIEHGIKSGMNMSVEQEKLAVETGYWHLFRYDPRNLKDGKNPFMLDSREPKKKIVEFLETENRYTALKKISPEIAQKIFDVAQKQADEKYQNYLRLSKLDYSL